jgi:hypothetical protein
MAIQSCDTVTRTRFEEFAQHRLPALLWTPALALIPILLSDCLPKADQSPPPQDYHYQYTDPPVSTLKITTQSFKYYYAEYGENWYEQWRADHPGLLGHLSQSPASGSGIAPMPVDWFPFCTGNALFPNVTGGQFTADPVLYVDRGSTPSPPILQLQSRTARIDCAGRSHNPYGSPAAVPISGLTSQYIRSLLFADGTPGFAGVAGNGVNVTLVNPDLSTKSTTSYGTGPAAAALVVWDFNGDGNPDLAVINAGREVQPTGPPSVSILLGNSDGTFQKAVNYLSGNDVFSMANGDFNHDSIPDLIVAGNNGLTLLLGNGDGTFRTGAMLSTAGGPIAVADVNHDGFDDVIVGVTTVNSTTAASGGVLLGNGDGTFRPLIAFPSAPGGGFFSFQSLALGDFDHDGKPDLAGLTANFVAVLKGNGDGSFKVSSTYASLYYEGGPDNLILTDVDGDGNLDIAIGNGDAGLIGPAADGHVIYLLLGNGDCTFQGAPFYNFGAPTIVARGHTRMAVADFNSDGKPDVLMNDEYGQLYLATNQGNFQFQTSSPVSSGFGYPVAADINGDGKQDLIGTDNVFAVNSDNVLVRLGNGNGTFQPAATYSVGPSPGAIAIGDLNGDQKPDIAVITTASNGAGQVAVLLSTGSGGFAPALSYAVGNNPSGIAIGDFNGDGKLDIAVSDTGATVLLNKGNGTFQSGVSLTTGANPTAIAAADLNGDGRVDLAVLYGPDTTGGVSVLLGKGDGTFQSAVNLPTEYFPNSFLIGDFDHDGNLDIAITHQLDTTIMFGLGGGSFAPEVGLVAGGNVGGLVLADLNGDNRLDLIAGATGGFVVFPGAAPLAVSATPITLASSPSGLNLTVDGLGCTTPCTVPLNPGEQHTITANPPNQPASAAKTRYGFSSWSDGGAASHTITVPSTPTTYTATFATQYLLTTLGLPAGAGSVGPSPLSPDGYYNAGTAVQLTAAPSPNFQLLSWFGDVSGSTSPQSITMNAPHQATAKFAGITGSGPAVLTPISSGTAGSSANFTFQFNDGGNASSLSVVNVLINDSLDGRHACYLAYVNATSTLILVDDAGDAGGPYAGSVTTGNPNTVIQNSQCAVSLLSVTSNLQTLTLNLNITFKSGFGGNHIQYLAARDNAGNNTGWQAMGVWQAPPAPSGVITVKSASPSPAASPGGYPQTFTFTLTDTKGASDIGILNVLANNFIDGRAACYLAYVVSSNSLLLVDDAGDAGGPFAGSMVLNGSAATIQNSQCSINGAASSVTAAGDTLQLTLAITFQSGLTGSHVIWLAGRDAAGANNTGWQAMATGSVQ